MTSREDGGDGGIDKNVLSVRFYFFGVAHRVRAPHCSLISQFWQTHFIVSTYQITIKTKPAI